MTPSKGFSSGHLSELKSLRLRPLKELLILRLAETCSGTGTGTGAGVTGTGSGTGAGVTGTGSGTGAGTGSSRPVIPGPTSTLSLGLLASSGKNPEKTESLSSRHIKALAQSQVWTPVGIPLVSLK